MLFPSCSKEQSGDLTLAASCRTGSSLRMCRLRSLPVNVFTEPNVGHGATQVQTGPELQKTQRKNRWQRIALHSRRGGCLLKLNSLQQSRKWLLQKLRNGLIYSWDSSFRKHCYTVMQMVNWWVAKAKRRFTDTNSLQIGPKESSILTSNEAVLFTLWDSGSACEGLCCTEQRKWGLTYRGLVWPWEPKQSLLGYFAHVISSVMIPMNPLFRFVVSRGRKQLCGF